MCGITGILRVGQTDLDVRCVDDMSKTLHHRGPDGFGTWKDHDVGIGLGHRRLSIIDLSSRGNQPMLSASGRYVIVYNGEVYNFRELREDLAVLGINFKGNSDTEVMLAAIETWGIAEAVTRFVGMFAFALWDTQKRILSLVRDRLGIKPLYWGLADGIFLFGSELKALRACPGWRFEINRDALAAYMRWNYVPSPHSIYHGIQKLEPGTILTMAPKGEPHLEQFWDIRQVARKGVATPMELTDPEAVKALDEALVRAVECHMVADVPLGAFLSGGIDSSLVVALMSAHSGSSVKTFSIGFREDGYDEAAHAKTVARHLGTEHTELYFDPTHALEVVPRLPEYYDEPFADSSQLPTFLVSEMTRRHVTVALSGDGGDELFAGYSRYHWADMVWRRFGQIPLPLRQGMAAAIRRVPVGAWKIADWSVLAAIGDGRLADRANKFAHYAEQACPDNIYRAQHCHWSPEAVVLEGEEASGLACDDGLTSDIPEFIERMQLMDTLQYLPDDVMTKVDRASMAVSLETRVPLLDHRVVELAWRMPRRMKYRDGEAKWALRQVLYKYVPCRLIDRPKMGFAAPVGTWLRGPLRAWAEELLDEARLRNERFFEARAIRKNWNLFLAGDNSVREQIWGVLMFQAWHEAQEYETRKA